MGNLLAYGENIVGNVSGDGAAASISYDNTTSGLPSINVQDAIDDLAGDLGDKVSSSVIQSIQVVTTLPVDASSHPEILYLVRG